MFTLLNLHQSEMANSGATWAKRNFSRMVKGVNEAQGPGTPQHCRCQGWHLESSIYGRRQVCWQLLEQTDGHTVFVVPEAQSTSFS